MRIGLVLDDTLDTPDGVQQYVVNVGSWLTLQGHDVHYLVGNTTRTDLQNVHSLGRNIHVKFNGNRMSMPLPTSRQRLREFLAEQQFDILHVQVPYSPFLAGRLLHVAPKRTAVVGTFHILPYSYLVQLANRVLAIWNRRSGRRFQAMLAVSEPAKAFAERVYGYKNIQVIPNPVRISQFANALSANSAVNIVFLGRLVARKGAQHLIAAVNELVRRKNTTDFHVYIGGKGELLEELQKMVVSQGLTEFVSFDGFIPEGEKANYLAKADIAIFPSTSGESFGIILLEAMAAARGVVLAGNNPGYASVMLPFNDQLFQPKNILEMADILELWLSDGDARTHAAIAQKTYAAVFDVGIVGERLAAIYAAALQSQRHP